MAVQYAIVSLDPFVCLTDPSQTPTILDWEAPLNKEKSSGNTMNTVVNTKSVGMWMPYSAISYWWRSKTPTQPPPTTQAHVHGILGYPDAPDHCKPIQPLCTDLHHRPYAKQLQTSRTLQPQQPAYETLYKDQRVVNYATGAGETFTKEQLIQIMYILIVETGQFQYDCRTWQARSEHEKNMDGFTGTLHKGEG